MTDQQNYNNTTFPKRKCFLLQSDKKLANRFARANRKAKESDALRYLILARDILQRHPKNLEAIGGHACAIIDALHEIVALLLPSQSRHRSNSVVHGFIIAQLADASSEKIKNFSLAIGAEYAIINIGRDELSMDYIPKRKGLSP
jgi:hypothetical protein